MKHIILCGGLGERMNNYSLPKPLNFIEGKHMIEYVINNIQDTEIFIIYNKILKLYNIEEILVNKCKEKKINFVMVDYITRGAVETAYIGLKQIIDKFDRDENIVFIDNDVLINMPESTIKYENNFIGYSYDNIKTNYSFIELLNNNVINIEEKKKISDFFCCGYYGFKNINVFLTNAFELLQTSTNTEYYFSQLYKLNLKNEIKIDTVYFDNVKHLGSLNEIINYKPNNILRICFDLDNTLVTYPSIQGDYSSVLPIDKNIKLLRELKNKGHIIIIYTARRMKTHGGNIGKVMKDIAEVTFENLNKFKIEYDEIVFGKPIADIYIDDRSINPYINTVDFFGLNMECYVNDEDNYIHNKLNENKYNKIKKCNVFNKTETITKTGPFNYMRGEIYFYEFINTYNDFDSGEIINFFPKYYGHKIYNETITNNIEYIKGIPLFYLYKNKLLNTNIIDDLFDILDKLHNLNGIKINVSDENIRNNYFKKLIDRFNNVDYQYPNAQEKLNNILLDIDNNYQADIRSIIHGDFWFSNIIKTNDGYKLIDMKGQVDNILTTNGDIYYDYGKLYQSILGYDLIINNCYEKTSYHININNYFIKKCELLGLNIKYLNAITQGLIFGTFWFITDNNIKDNIWNLLL